MVYQSLVSAWARPMLDRHHRLVVVGTCDVMLPYIAYTLAD